MAGQPWKTAVSRACDLTAGSPSNKPCFDRRHRPGCSTLLTPQKHDTCCTIPVQQGVWTLATVAQHIPAATLIVKVCAMALSCQHTQSGPFGNMSTLPCVPSQSLSLSSQHEMNAWAPGQLLLEHSGQASTGLMTAALLQRCRPGKLTH